MEEFYRAAPLPIVFKIVSVTPFLDKYISVLNSLLLDDGDLLSPSKSTVALPDTVLILLALRPRVHSSPS